MLGEVGVCGLDLADGAPFGFAQGRRDKPGRYVGGDSIPVDLPRSAAPSSLSDFSVYLIFTKERSFLGNRWVEELSEVGC